MALWRGIVMMTWFLILELILMAPFVHSFRRPLSDGAINMSHDTANQTLKSSAGSSRASSSRNGAEDSAREVPTGPDPLHHNNNPTGP